MPFGCGPLAGKHPCEGDVVALRTSLGSGSVFTTRRAGSTASRRVSVLFLIPMYDPYLLYCGSTSTCSTLPKDIYNQEVEESADGDGNAAVPAC